MFFFFFLHVTYYHGLFACASKSRRGKLVNWVEKVSFEKIRKLLEIFERERHHEVLFTLKNLGNLSRNPTPYILFVIPRPLPTEVVEGEHFVTIDLLHLLSGSSSLARESEADTAGRELVIRTQPRQPFASEDFDPARLASRGDERGGRVKRLLLER